MYEPFFFSNYNRSLTKNILLEIIFLIILLPIILIGVIS